MLSSFKAEVDGSTREQHHCNTCDRKSIHLVHAKCKAAWGDREFQGGDTYKIVKCGGCDTVRFVVDRWDSEDFSYDEDGEMYATITTKIYPPASTRNFKMDDILELPQNIYEVFSETLQAQSSNHLILATIGSRLLIETVCDSFKIKGKNLKEKIASLQTSGHVDVDEEALLQKVREYGNASAHGAKAMTSKQIASALEIVYHVVDKLFLKPSREKAMIEKAKAALS